MKICLESHFNSKRKFLIIPSIIKVVSTIQQYVYFQKEILKFFAKELRD